MLLAALVGFGIAFIGALPVAGPVAVLVAERALTHRPREVVWMAVGAALPEAMYAAAAGLGAQALLERWPALVPVSHAVGAGLLGVLAVTLVRAPSGATRSGGRDGSAFVLGFVLTLANPTLLLTWSAVAAPLVGLGALVDRADALVFGAAAGAGGLVGTLAMARALESQRHRLGPRAEWWVRRLAAAGLALCAVALLVRAAG